ncbi:hypothetical protein SFRURICE_015614 [Spodoptera frugiperda]|nr:hypothetical protein SFRURICE_015614 [Spodoptera frugiperda]
MPMVKIRVKVVSAIRLLILASAIRTLPIQWTQSDAIRPMRTMRACGRLPLIHLIQTRGQLSTFNVRVHRPASYASHATDFSLSCIETHTTAATDPHRTDRIIGNAYMRCVLMTSYGMRAMRTMRG